MEREIELKDLCRICAVGSESEAVYPLIVNNELTNLGEKFVSCLGIQVGFHGWHLNMKIDLFITYFFYIHLIYLTDQV